jgi:hypothetical protein
MISQQLLYNQWATHLHDGIIKSYINNDIQDGLIFALITIANYEIENKLLPCLFEKLNTQIIKSMNEIINYLKYLPTIYSASFSYRNINPDMIETENWEQPIVNNRC